jgi:hypothetical protein
MSPYLYVSCACGAHLADRIRTEFEQGFLRDEFGIRAKLDIPDPPEPFASGAGTAEVAPAAFIGWHERAAAALSAGAGELPILYQVWLRTGDTGRTGRAVYFEMGGKQYSVFASLSPTLVVHRLPDGWLREKLLPAQRASTSYAQSVIPRVEERGPDAACLPADAEGDTSISPRGFEALFRDCDVELEALPFAEVFARELRELAGAAGHARYCDRPLRLHHV